MNDGHLRDGVGDDDRDDGAEKIGEDYARAGKPDCHRAAEEEADSDRAADRHHGELALREPALEFGRALGRAGRSGCNSR